MFKFHYMYLYENSLKASILKTIGLAKKHYKFITNREHSKNT